MGNYFLLRKILNLKKGKNLQFSSIKKKCRNIRQILVTKIVKNGRFGGKKDDDEKRGESLVGYD